MKQEFYLFDLQYAEIVFNLKWIFICDTNINLGIYAMLKKCYCIKI